jgi:hypothetical protein
MFSEQIYLIKLEGLNFFKDPLQSSQYPNLPIILVSRRCNLEVHLTLGQ